MVEFNIQKFDLDSGTRFNLTFGGISIIKLKCEEPGLASHDAGQ